MINTCNEGWADHEILSNTACYSHIVEANSKDSFLDILLYRRKLCSIWSKQGA